MRFRTLAACGLVCLIGSTEPGKSDETRTVTVNGVPYRETYRAVRRPVTGVQWDQKEVTRYVEQHTTEMRQMQRPVYVPHVRYEWQARVRDRWNPFVQPSVAYELVPRTHWETRLETVKVPVVRRELVPEKRLVDVPRRTLGFEEQQELVSRVPLPAASAAPAAIARGPQIFASPGPPQPSTAATAYPAPPPVGGVERYDGPYPARRPAAATQLR